MKEFTFSLERVLRWRITSFRKEQLRLEQIRFSLEEARAANASLAESFSAAKESAGSDALLTGADLYALDSYTARLSREIALGNQRMSSISETIAKQMVVVSGCDRNVRLLERLRDRHRTDWQTEMNRETDAQSGDFSASQWLRNKQTAAPSGEPE
jgi:flagellar biosynthesis chaperone FliJ